MPSLMDPSGYYSSKVMPGTTVTDVEKDVF